MSSSEERATSPIESPPSSPLTELSRTPSPPPWFEEPTPPSPKAKKSVTWGANQVIEIPNENNGKHVRAKKQEKRIHRREEVQRQPSGPPPVIPRRRRRYQYKPLATPADIAARPRTRFSDLWFEKRPVPAQEFTSTTLDTNNRASSKRKSPSEDEDEDEEEVEISTTSTSTSRTTKR